MKQTSLIDKFVALVSPLENRVVGMASAVLSRSNNTAGESALGDIIGFLVLNNGSNRLGGAQDLDALEAWIKAHTPVLPGLQNHIHRLN